MKIDVNKIVEVHGVKVVSFERYSKLGIFVGFANALYDVDEDCIALNEDPVPNQPHYNRDLILLHEIVHWTAHPKRLDRHLDRSTEELVAEIAGRQIGELLGFDGKLLAARFEEGITKAGIGNYMLAAQEADKATNYLWHDRLTCEEFEGMSYWIYK